nr:ribosomal protein L14 [Cibotium barometz]
MIQTQSYSDVADNSGARKPMCIRVLGTGNRRYADTGDTIIAVVKEAVPNMSMKRSEVVRVVAACTRKEMKRDNGMILRFDDNAAVVINQEGNPRGTRIFGPVARESREYNFARIVSLAPEVSQ